MTKDTNIPAPAVRGASERRRIDMSTDRLDVVLPPIRVSADFREKLSSAAASRGVTVSTYIRETLGDAARLDLAEDYVPVVPYDVSTPRKRQLAEAERRRLNVLTGYVHGGVWYVADWAKIVAVSNPEELRGLANGLADSLRVYTELRLNLLRLARQLEEDEEA
jgi:hypothetical protein